MEWAQFRSYHIRVHDYDMQLKVQLCVKFLLSDLYHNTASSST